MASSRPGRALWLLMALLLCKPPMQAFCNSPIRPRSRIPREAKSPIRELEQKLSKVLGRKPNKGDMVWRFEASLDLPCLANISRVEKVTINSASLEECKRKAASKLLNSLDFDELMALAPKTEKAEKAEKAELSGANESQGLADVEVGDNLTLKVTRRSFKALRLDLGGKEVTLPAAELRDGFPTSVPGRGTELKVRVLSKARGTLVTLREGSLERPAKKKVKVNVSALADHFQKYEAEVLDFTFDDAVVKVFSEPETMARLPRNQFAEGIEEELKIGSKIQVRLKYTQKDRVIVSMKERPSRNPMDLQPGEELTGRILSVLRTGEKPAAFLDVGFDRPAYLDWQEVSDTLQGKTFVRLKIGKEMSCRVLRVQQDRIYVTRRTGDLYRPTFEETPPKAEEKIVDLFRDLPKDQWLDARVLRIYPRYSLVTVQAPDGTEAAGYVPRRFWSEDFFQSPAPNQKVKVRCLEKLPKAKGGRSRVMLTMLEPTSKAKPEAEAAEAEAAEAEEAEAEEAEEAVEEAQEEATTTPPPDEGPLKGIADFLMR